MCAWQEACLFPLQFIQFVNEGPAAGDMQSI